MLSFIKITLLLILSISVLSSESYSQIKNTGIIRGKIIDEITESPLENASVELGNTGIITITNKKGEFTFKNLAFDSYEIKISSAGYEPLIKSDLTIYASKPLEIVVNLKPKGVITDVIDVEANSFEKSSNVNISSINLNYEEIRRAPGAAEDISRMLQTAPGVAIGNDQRNDIIIRGGSPSENLIIIDGIEIPNINHFGTDGSTSGAIGFINSKFIREADMLTGGFPSLYGDRLSGVINIKFKEGSRKEFYTDVNLSISGFGAVVEGPLSEKGSVLFSVRRSYLELIHNAIRLTSVPNYWDVNLKAVFDLTPTDKLTYIGLLGLDKIDFSGESAEDNPFGNSSSDQTTIGTGVSYKKLFSKGYLQNVLSYSGSVNNVIQIDGPTAEINFENDAYNNELILQSDYNYQLSRSVILNTGIGGKYVFNNSYLYLKGDTSAAGFVYDTINSNSDINTFKLFGHVNFTTKFLEDRLILNTGARVDYFDYIRLQTYFSPRAGATYNFTPVTSFNLAWGIYFQSPEYIWLSSSPLNSQLNSIRCEHYIAGLDHFFSSDIKATAEIFYKKYKDYPVWVDIPTYILIDGGAEFGPNIVGVAASAGNGYTKGFDISIQKKLSGTGLYGMINYSYINSGFTALAGNEKPGAFDPGNQFTLIAGYQFKNGWLLGTKFKYSGGRPYTPINNEASELVNRAVFATDDFNSARYPYYMRIDLRVDKKFDFRNASLVAYLEVQNLFDRQNIYSYYWDDNENELGTIYQWAFFPLGGISVQF